MKTPPSISVGGVQIDGVEDVLAAAGDRVAQVFRAGVARAYVEGELIIAEAKKRTPVDDGHLRKSGHVPAPEYTRDGARIRLVFGGPSAPYAIYVHEDLRPKNWNAKGTGPKFLESAHREAMPEVRRRVVDAMRAALRKR